MRFTEAPIFLLREFFSFLSQNLESAFIDGITVETFGYFDLIVEIDLVTRKDHFVIPFLPNTPMGSEDNFLLVDRCVHLETADTSAVSIGNGEDVFLKKSSIAYNYRTDTETGLTAIDKTLDSFVRTKANSNPQMVEYVTVQKPWLYLGKIYRQGSSETLFRVKLMGMADFAISCLPPHLQTEKIISLFWLYFDEVYGRLYNKQRAIGTLFDALEIDIEYIDYLADLYGITLNKPFIDELKSNRNDPVARKNERRLREYVREMPNYFKRKGTYASLFIIFQNSFWKSNNKLTIYDRYHDNTICNGWPENPYTIPDSPSGQFLDFDYLKEYNIAPSGCVPFYGDVMPGLAYPVSLDDCYIHKQVLRSYRWLILHNLNNWKDEYNYSIGNVVFNDAGTSFMCSESHTSSVTTRPIMGYEWETYWYEVEDVVPPIQPVIQCLDLNLNIIHPKEILVTGPNTCMLLFDGEAKTGFALMANHQWVSPVTNTTETITHNLNQVAPILMGSKAITYTLNEYRTFPASAYVGLEELMVKGADSVVVTNVLMDADMHLIALSGDYFHRQPDPIDVWNIEHNLNSKAIMADFYVSKPASIWYISHTLESKDIVFEVLDANNELCPYNSTSITSDSLIEINFSTEMEGSVLIKKADETITLPTSSAWFDTYSVSAGMAPITQIYDTEYNPIECEVTVIYKDSILVTGYGSGYAEIIIPDYTETILDKSDTWNVHHRLYSTDIITNVYLAAEEDLYEITNTYGSNNIFVQVFDLDGNLLNPTSIVIGDTISIALSAASTAFINSYNEDVEQSTFTYEHISPSASWWIEHYLDNYGINVRLYSGGIEVTDNADIQLYSKNWTTVTFSEPTSGYAVLYLSEQRIMSASKFYLTSDNIEIVDEDNLIITLPEESAGYVSCVVPDLKCTTLYQSTPYKHKVVPINPDNTTATFNPSAAGVAVIREVGQLSYGDGMIMTPHYRAEIDINCEPLCSPEIIEENAMRDYIAALEIARPVCKYPHYNILISPPCDFSMDKMELYGERFEDTKIYSYCCTDTTMVSGGYVHHKQGAYKYWNIVHNLGTYNILIQAYDNDGNLIFPIETILIDVNTVEIEFVEPQAGFALVLEASEYFINTVEASGTWGISHNLDTIETHPTSGYVPGYGVLSDYYFYDRAQLVPSNIDITAVNVIESLWYVPTLGFCNLHEYNYLHVQTEASYVWNIEHNLEYDGVLIQCFDEEHNIIQPYNIKLNKYIKSCTISFNESQVTGYAIVTAVGNILTKSYIIESIANGGYVKIGLGTAPDIWDAINNREIKEEIVPVTDSNVITSAPVTFVEDVFTYYILGKIEHVYESKSITEMGLYTAEGDLIFYTYVKPYSQFYKIEELDLHILYRIFK